MDQTDAFDGFGRNLVMNKHCQCNSYFSKNWNEWIDNWLLNAKNKPGFDYQGWFKKGKAPAWGGDIAACWHDNPKDMIDLQNALWWRRHEWSNQQAPLSSWQGVDYPASNRMYWGWNEVPVDRALMNDPSNWDAIIIKLPAALGNKIASNDDSIASLKPAAHLALEKELQNYINAGYLLLGAEKYSTKPGSSVLFVRETMDYNGNFQKEFYCQWWTSPCKWYDIIFVSDKGPTEKYDNSACYIQAHSAVAYV